MKECRFIQADVFTDRAFAGNPLAIFPEASALTAEEMQLIAREMNLSESTFVLPPTREEAALRLRIFTPTRELPLAGHPVVGTLFVLAQRGRFGREPGVRRVLQECGAGVLPVDVHLAPTGAVEKVVMTQAMPRFLATFTDRELLARAVGLEPQAVLPGGAPAQVVSTGLPQLMVPARSIEDLRRIEIDLAAMRRIFRELETDCFLIFTRETVDPENTAHARMFAPFLGVSEDPATGSACGALGAFLVRHGLVKVEPTTSLRVEQGYEMGRPSLLFVEVDTGPEGPETVRVGGRAVEVAEGVVRF